MTVEVLKKTGTYGDALVAIGVASLLKEIPGQRLVNIKDIGHAYLVSATPEVSQDDLDEWEPIPGYSFIKIKHEDKVLPGVGYFDYEREKEKEQIWREFVKKHPKLARDPQHIDGITDNIPERPDPNLALIKIYNSMRMNSNAYNNFFEEFYDQDSAALAKWIVNHLGLKSVDSTLDVSVLAKSISNLQLFNPVSGKGVNRTKPSGVSASSLPNKLVDWFDEWMKFRALWLGMLGYSTGSEGKDIKVLVLAPGDIEVNLLMKVRHQLQLSRHWGSVILDINFVLDIVDILITNSKEYLDKNSEDIYSFRGRKPNHIIRGIHTTFFKSMGQAAAVMNVSFLQLPGWLPIHDKEDAIVWIELIREHKRCLSSLNESRSGDVAILLAYREFLSSGALMDGLEFFSMYASHFMRRKAANEWVEAFTTLNLRRLVMSYNDCSVKEIVDSEGFQNIATAIRKSTINPQIRKSIDRKAPFEIKYGLAQEWKRKSRYKNEFIAELSAFVQEYNAENAKHMEQGKETRQQITTKDLDEVLALIEKSSSELVAMLLLAYGYAREPKEKQAEAEQIEGGMDNEN